LPIWKLTVPLGEPVAFVLTAEKLTVDEGQNQPELVAQSGSRPVRLYDEVFEEKNRPFEPVSIKLPVKEEPSKVVVNSPYWSSTAYAVTPEGKLFARVPIPSTREPLTEGEPPKGTLGSWTITPLLSCGRSATGFWT
jgi:hypothetical protein